MASGPSRWTRRRTWHGQVRGRRRIWVQAISGMTDEIPTRSIDLDSNEPTVAVELVVPRKFSQARAVE